MARSIEIFSGAGGLALGSVMAGADCELLIDSAKDAHETLQMNIDLIAPKHDEAAVIRCRIEDHRFEKYRDIDLLLGGPPCQPFSQGGRRKSHTDNRNMFPEIVRIIEECAPKAFVFENVKGIATGQNRNFAELVRLQLQFPEYAQSIVDLEWQEQLLKLEDYLTSGGGDGLRYNVIQHIADAADYGVPQKRERVFFIGFRSDKKCEWHFPAPTHSAAGLNFSQSARGDYWDRHRIRKKDRIVGNVRCPEEKPSLLPWLTIRDAISGLPTPTAKDAVPSTKISEHIFIPGARQYRGHTGSWIDGPSKTLKAGVHGVPGGENMLRRADGSVRYFTIRECARLQTFPDEYRFAGSWTSKMRQLGNAVPCRLAQAVVGSVLHTLEVHLNKKD